MALGFFIWVNFAGYFQIFCSILKFSFHVSFYVNDTYRFINLDYHFIILGTMISVSKYFCFGGDFVRDDHNENQISFVFFIPSNLQ